MLETVAALCVVLGAIVVLRGLVVRMGIGPMGRGTDARIRVVETIALGPKQQLHLVEVDGRNLLLGASESGLARIARLPDRPRERALDRLRLLWAPDLRPSRRRRRHRFAR